MQTLGMLEAPSYTRECLLVLLQIQQLQMYDHTGNIQKLNYYVKADMRSGWKPWASLQNGTKWKDRCGSRPFPAAA